MSENEELELHETKVQETNFLSLERPPVAGKEPIKATGQKFLQCFMCPYSGYTKNAATSALRHVAVCLKLRPYSCSQCKHLFNDRSQAAKHCKSNCPGATVQVPHRLSCTQRFEMPWNEVLFSREEMNRAVKDGFTRCFPEDRFNWSGF